MAYLVGYGCRITLLLDGRYGVVGHRLRPLWEVLTGAQIVRLASWIDQTW